VPELKSGCSCSAWLFKKNKLYSPERTHPQVAVPVFYAEAIVDHIGVSVIMPELGAARWFVEKRDAAHNKFCAEVF
jgi:hypothetical protein